MKCKYEWERNSDHELSMKTATNVQHFQWQKVKETMRWMVRWNSIIYFFLYIFNCQPFTAQTLICFLCSNSGLNSMSTRNKVDSRTWEMKFYEKSEMNDSAISVDRKMRALNLNCKSHLHFVPFLIPISEDEWDDDLNQSAELLS